ncbi:MAG: SH3 domain-containing protein [Patescibacteria group bacterium]
MNQNGGYVYDAYYAITTPPLEGQVAQDSVLVPQDAIITGDTLISVYEQPEPNAKVVKQLLPGVRLRALVQKQGWVSVLLSSGQEAWVQEEFLELVTHTNNSTSIQQE